MTMMATIVPRISSTDVGTSAHGVLVFYFFLEIAGAHVLLPILLAVFTFNTRATRHPTLINLCLTWILSGIFSCTLLYWGVHEGPEPPFGLCVTQSSLVYGVPPMTATAVCALVFQVWLGLFNSKKETVDPRWRTFRTALLLTAPYIVYGSWATAAAWLGIQNPERVSRNRRFFYCSLEYAPFTDGIGLFTALILIVTMTFEIWIAVILRKNWRDIRRAGSRGGVALDLIFRVCLFGVYVMLGMVLSLLSLVAPKSPIPDLWVASVPMIVVIIFGSQKDVFRALIFWRKDEQKLQVKSQDSIEQLEKEEI